MIRPPDEVTVHPGPLLLAGIADGPGLTAHRRRFGKPPPASAGELVDLLQRGEVRGRGGAGFPLARKLDTVLARRGRLTRRPVVVVNGAEGEPASAKDSALLTVAPHLVLDGAALTARALGTRTVHVVVARDRPWVAAALAGALDERDDGMGYTLHEAEPRFVAGQARSVLELMSGRDGLPVTAWAPEAVDGHRGRPTLLSNVESWAHLAVLAHHGPDAYTALGTSDEPGTTLLTVSRPPDPSGRFAPAAVVEVEHGADLAAQLRRLPGAPLEPGGPVLVGGFHGGWLPAEQVPDTLVSQADLRERGLALGAGALVVLPPRACVVAETARYVRYLAAESAGRCGPCRNGLPAMAQAADRLAAGVDTRRRLRELCGLVAGRGACAHPDGTARLVTSLLVGLSDRVDQHLAHRCGCARRTVRRAS